MNKGRKSGLTGLIEGFYGRPWTFAQRRIMVDDLARLGLDTYLYAPKADAHLRRRWTEDWPASERRALEALAAHCRERDVAFCPGLSPFRLHECYGPEQRRRLRERLRSLDDLGAPLLAVLFDDMPGALPELAARQAEIVTDIAAWSDAAELLVCPTYYSDDPVLDRVFGVRPPAYREQLGAALPARARVLWTGSAVCPGAVSRDDLASAAAAFGRAVTLWDNWPVNDSATRSRHLYLSAPPAREGALTDCCAGHLCNAMNQPTLSLPALAGLAALHGRIGDAGEWLRQRLGGAMSAALAADAALLATVPRDELAAPDLLQLRERYATLAGAPGREMLAWLAGDWAFDPACLTD